MKFFLTLFDLLFSSSLFAGDDLTGKKIFCVKKSEDSYHLLGFNFITSNKVRIYRESEILSLDETETTYRTTALNIITFETVLNKVKLGKKEISPFKIQRKNLSVYYASDKWTYKSDNCNLVKGIFVKIIADAKKDIMKENLI